MRAYRLIVLMLAWALLMLLWNIHDTMERTVVCQMIGTSEACCPREGCKFSPASDSRPVE